MGVDTETEGEEEEKKMEEEEGTAETPCHRWAGQRGETPRLH